MKRAATDQDLKQHADRVLAPAACYPYYPRAAARFLCRMKVILRFGRRFFSRHEPSRRSNSFQIFPHARLFPLGTPQQIQAFRHPGSPRPGHRGFHRPLLTVTCQRSLLRPGRAIMATSSARRAEIRIAVRWRFGAVADRLHELSTSTRAFRSSEVWGPSQGGRNPAQLLRRFGMDRLAVALCFTHCAKI